MGKGLGCRWFLWRLQSMDLGEIASGRGAIGGSLRCKLLTMMGLN